LLPKTASTIKNQNFVIQSEFGPSFSLTELNFLPEKVKEIEIKLQEELVKTKPTLSKSMLQISLKESHSHLCKDGKYLVSPCFSIT
jgi:hypothetical protein